MWRLSAILNLRKLPFWSRDRHLRVIIHLFSEIRINWPIWRRYIDKNTIFNMASVQSALLNLENFDFCQFLMLGMEICICEKM